MEVHKLQWIYGKYEWQWERQSPTKDKFENWKNEFLSLPESNNYNVWLTGGFLESWKTNDIDIILTGPKNLDKIEKLLYKGTDLGIKNNMFVDITYQLSPKFPDINLQKNMSPNVVQKIGLGSILIQDGIILTSWKHVRKINSALSVRTDIYPKEGQLTRNYKQEPIKIN